MVASDMICKMWKEMMKSVLGETEKKIFKNFFIQQFPLSTQAYLQMQRTWLTHHTQKNWLTDYMTAVPITPLHKEQP